MGKEVYDIRLVLPGLRQNASTCTVECTGYHEKRDRISYRKGANVMPNRGKLK